MCMMSACIVHMWVKNTYQLQLIDAVMLTVSTDITVCAQTIHGLNFRRWRIFTIITVFIFADVQVLNIILHIYAIYILV